MSLVIGLCHQSSVFIPVLGGTGPSGSSTTSCEVLVLSTELLKLAPSLNGELLCMLISLSDLCYLAFLSGC